MIDISIIIFLLVLLLLNITVFTVSKGSRESLINSGLLVMFLCAPIIFFITSVIIGTQTGDGIAGGVAGITFGVIAFINGFVIFIIGLFKKRKEE